jgi:hypothetical protein
MQSESESLFFTIINPDNVEEETRFNVFVGSDGNFALNGLAIDAQQLAELGMLLFALANRGVPSDTPDLDSCNELLDGFSIPMPVKALQELINIEKEG